MSLARLYSASPFAEPRMHRGAAAARPRPPTNTTRAAATPGRLAVVPVRPVTVAGSGLTALLPQRMHGWAKYIEGFLRAVDVSPRALEVSLLIMYILWSEIECRNYYLPVPSNSYVCKAIIRSSQCEEVDNVFHAINIFIVSVLVVSGKAGNCDFLQFEKPVPIIIFRIRNVI